MSWSDRQDRRRLLRAGGAMALAMALGGCLRPMLAEGTASTALQGQIALPPIDDRLSRVMSVRLEERLGRPVATPLYRLEVRRSYRRRGLLVEQDNTITRIQLQGKADWRLFRRGEVEPIDEGSVRTEAGFDQTASLFASRTTVQDVERRVTEDLAERIARRLLGRADRYVKAG